MTCDDYQIAFEQQRAGATASITPTELDAHVAACASCAAYLEVSRKVDASMNTILTLSPPLDADKIRGDAARLARQANRGMWTITLSVCGVLGAQVFLRGDPVRWTSIVGLAIGMLAAILVARPVYRAMTRKRLERLNALASATGPELVAGFRADLDWQLRDTRFALWFIPAITAFGLWNDGRLLDGRWPSPLWLLLTASMVVSLPIVVIRRRRLKRERALIG